MTVEFWRGASLMSGVLAMAMVVLAYMGRLPRHNGEIKRIIQLEATIEVLQEGHVRDQQRITELERELAKTKGELERVKMQLASRSPTEGERVLLAVIGGDPDLRVDLAALRKVENDCDITVTRCLPNRFDRFQAILNRYRKEGRPIRYVHFSVHSRATPAAAAFDDGPVGGEQLSGVMNDVKICFLDGCESDMLGDVLGIVPAVMTWREKVTMEHGALATELFWGAIGKGLAPRAAYQQTRARLPAEVAEYLEFHG